jgi:hypothetical protein
MKKCRFPRVAIEYFNKMSVEKLERGLVNQLEILMNH